MAPITKMITVVSSPVTEFYIFVGVSNLGIHVKGMQMEVFVIHSPHRCAIRPNIQNEVTRPSKLMSKQSSPRPSTIPGQLNLVALFRSLI